MTRPLSYATKVIDATDGEPSELQQLSAVERAIHASLQSMRRRAEFVAGRLALRAAIAELLGACPATLVIDREADGAPHLRGIERPLSISITHGRTHAYAVVAIGDEPIGVDLCDHADAPRIRRVAHRAFPREIERALVLRDDHTVRVAWAVKEAVGKALRIGLLYDAGFERIELLAIDPPRIACASDPRSVVVSVREVDEGVLATALVSRSSAL